MKIIGLTGGIASGKSTVSQMFKDINIPVIDTDQIARSILHKGTVAYNEVVDLFSKEILFANHDINRKALGRLIFSNKKKRNQLNEIVHPRVKTIVLNEIEAQKELGADIVVIDVPLLFETDFYELVDYTIVVYTSREKQRQRLIERDHIDKEYAEMKIKAQMSLSNKADMADFVIDNSHSILQTKKDFLKVIDSLGVK